MVIGDIFVINKCDRPGVERMEGAIISMLSLAHRHDNWVPTIVKSVATQGVGITDLMEKIETCRRFFDSSAIRAQKKREAARQRLMTQLQEQLVSAAVQQVFSNGDLDRIAGEIAERKQDPYTIVDRIVRNAKFGRP